jgi:glycosyltransferase involved in cell wall biosynthesis
MRVGIFTLRDLTVQGGSLIRLSGLTRGVKDLGWDVTLMAPTPAPALSDVVDFVRLDGGNRRASLSIPYAAFPTLLSPARWLPADRRLASLLRAQRLDIIHCHQHPAGFRLLKLGGRTGVPVVFELHGILNLQQADLRAEVGGVLALAMYLRAERHLFRRIGSIIVRTDAERDYLERFFALPVAKIHVVPDGADVDFLDGARISDMDKAEARTRLGLDGKRVIAFGGWFKLPSGVMDLVRAFALLRRQRPDVALLLVGDGLLMPEVRRLVAEQSIPNVVITGFTSREEFRVFQQLANVVVTPEIKSFFNELGAPLKLFECLASGRPTVATRIRSHQAIVEDGVNGFLVEPESPDGIAAGLSRALDSPDRAAIGRRGRQTVVEAHTWRHSAVRAVRTYEAILKGGT